VSSSPINTELRAEEVPGRPLFENEDWAVTSAGLEHKRTGYFIEREHLSDRRSDGLWTWPAHILEKSWCTPQSFTEAFVHAVLASGIRLDPGLAQSFLEGDLLAEDLKTENGSTQGVPSRDLSPGPLKSRAASRREQVLRRRSVRKGRKRGPLAPGSIGNSRVQEA